jgi:predicted NBD/HSP70 family sugar kinase
MSIEPDSIPNHVALRGRSITAVLDALRENPRRSRAELAAQTGLSKPTVASALRALEGGGLVRERGRSTGKRGPSASLYEPVASAALVLAVDIGAHHVRAVVADLDGEPRDEAEAEVKQPDIDHVLEALRALRIHLAHPSIELAIVGSPGVVDPTTGRIRSSPQISGWEGIQAQTMLTDVLGVQTVVENDVNLAALGEFARGAGRGHGSFAYLNVGSGVGAGLVFDGQLRRGPHGAAGEVGYLAVGPDPVGDTTVSRGAMETRLSNSAIVRFARSIDPAAPDDPSELFARARTGDPLGRAVVTETVQALAICIASITAVVDLDLVLLGGGIGSQGDVLLEPVRAATAALVPYAPEIVCGALGDDAALAGGVATGAEQARAAAIQRCLSHVPIIAAEPEPPLVAAGPRPTKRTTRTPRS